MASRQLKVEIIGDASSLNRAFGSATKTSGGLGRALTNLGKVAAVGVGAAFVGLGIVVKKGFDELAEGQKVTAQTAARLKSTGDAAHVTAQQVSELATAQSKLTGIDDEAVQAGENMLLTFTNIRNEVGKTNDIFDQATVAVEDMATAMNDGAIPSAEQLSTTAIRVGKALNDPVKGMTALSRVGVQFTADQKKTIEALVKSGDTMGAQKLILAELTKEFGGSAKAAGETFPGQLAKLRNAFDDASSKVAVVFLPALTKAMGFITDKLIPAISNAADFIGNFWKGISEKLSRAPTLKAKLRVVFTGVETLAKQLVDALFSQIERLLPQKPLIFQPQTKVAVGGGGADWDAIANDMLLALGEALRTSVVLAQGLASAITSAIGQVDWVSAGKAMGPGFATMLGEAIKTILDPVFWIKNWELTLALAAVVFRVKIGEFGLRAGLFLSEALVKAVARVSPVFSAALGRLIFDAWEVGFRVFDVAGKKLSALAVAVFGRLAKIAVFTIKVLGIEAAISAIADFVRGAIAKFKEFLDWVSRLPGKIKGYFADAGTWLYAAGAAIIQGLWDGAKSKVGGFLSWLGGLKKLIPLHKGPPAQDRMLLNSVGQLIMQGLGEGMEVGWKRVEQRLDALSPKLKEKTSQLVDAIKQGIENRQSIFATAFDGLVSSALEAFDKLTTALEDKITKKQARLTPGEKAQKGETPAERQLRIEQTQRDEQARQQAIQDAQAAVQKAVTARGAVVQGQGESWDDFVKRQQDAAQAVIDAQKSLDDAIYAEHQAQLEKTAAAERAALDKRAARERAARDKQAAAETKALDDSRELRRRHFEEQLGDLEKLLENGKISAAKFRENVIKLFDKFDVPFKNIGHVLGSALTEALNESFGDAANAAKRLIEAIAAGLAKAKFIVSIEVQQTKPKGKQHGGPVSKGSPYVVGEAGPELFVPTTAGKIIPAGATASAGVGGMAEIHTNVYIDSVQVTELVRREMLRFEKRNGRSAV